MGKSSIAVGKSPISESATFWISLGAAVAVLAAFPLAVGLSEAASEHHSIWSDGWFNIGLIAEIAGVFAAIYGVALYIAHRHIASQHGPCPDPDRHEEPIDAVHANPQIHAALTQIRADLDTAAAALEAAVKSRLYWPVTQAALIDKHWKSAKDILVAEPSLHETYRALDSAFKQTGRIAGIHFMRCMQGRHVQPADRLDEVLSAVQAAQEAVAQRLAVRAPASRQIAALRMGRLRLGIELEPK